MASGVAAESILFIGAIIAATALAGIMTGVVGGMSEGIRSRGEAEAGALRSDIEVINDPAAVDISPNPIFYAKNTGTRELATTDVVVLLNGDVSEAMNFDVLGSADDDTWTAGSVVQITVTDIALGTGDHRVRIIAGAGVFDDFAWSAT